MFLKNTLISYPAMLITSTKKSFEALGQMIGKTGKTIARLLQPASEYYDLIRLLANKELANKKELVLIFDDTLIRKIHSQFMEGSGRFFDTQLFRKIMAYKLLVAMLTDGKMALPLCATFLFPKELLPNPSETKLEWIQKVILMAQKMFPKTLLIVSADGAFASKEFLGWCVKNQIAAEVRMRSNCVVIFKGKKIAIRDIKMLRPQGRQMARTIAILWHKIPLFITAQRRIDKHGDETIVFQASTFFAKPSRHVQIYRMRWCIEKFFRTAKQHLGLQGCFSRKLEIQESHIASVLLAYSLVELDRKQRRLPTPEAAIRAAELKNYTFLNRYINRLDQLIDIARA